MPETARYTALVAKNAEKAAKDMSRVLQADIEAEQQRVEQILKEPGNSFGLLSMEFLSRHGLHLLGIGVKNALLVIGFINLAGTLCTFLVPESKGKSLEEISGENEDTNADASTREAGP
ncbi:hypothetical protein POM88_048997 [Heracleum sosnowskyi]|uniref:Uncharacterized protein n=1 Tax=Heracleum sosnowskyi TaxID=360622 RepID=A0AAD8M063_9APIA|nr:hypothetical protein POM88_048997 [Heracleum sosnowskyi]